MRNLKSGTCRRNCNAFYRKKWGNLLLGVDSRMDFDQGALFGQPQERQFSPQERTALIRMNQERWRQGLGVRFLYVYRCIESNRKMVPEGPGRQLPKTRGARRSATSFNIFGPVSCTCLSRLSSVSARNRNFYMATCGLQARMQGKGRTSKPRCKPGCFRASGSVREPHETNEPHTGSHSQECWVTDESR